MKCIRAQGDHEGPPDPRVVRPRTYGLQSVKAINKL